MNNIKIGDKALITTNDWFIAPDGKYYKAVFGVVKSIKSSDSTLGIKTNSRSTNWYAEIGNMTIAGCQIHYAIRTNDCNFNAVYESTTISGERKEYIKDCIIYDAGG